MPAAKHVLLPQEEAAAFAPLETALVAELAAVGALQILSARRIVVAAWRLARADCMQAEVLEFRSYAGVDAGLALIRGSSGLTRGSATRSFGALMRYRGAAMAEFTRALRILQALQAEQADQQSANAQLPEMPPKRPRVAARVTARPAPNEPDAEGASHCVDPQPTATRPDAPGAGASLRAEGT